MNEATVFMNETPPSAIHAARTTPFLSRPILSWTVAAALCGLFLALVGATGSYDYGLGLRLFLWLGLSAAAALLAIAAEAALQRTSLAEKGPLAWWVSLTIAIGLAMVPIIFLVNSSSGRAPLDMLPAYLSNSLIISGALSGLRIALGFITARNPIETNASAQSPRLLTRLSASHADAQLYAIGSEGHYVRVFTDRGDELVLMRMKEAMAEVGDVEGMQVHRSWWVARDAVRESRNAQGRLELNIMNQLWVPVSRTFRSAWQEARWLS